MSDFPPSVKVWQPQVDLMSQLIKKRHADALNKMKEDVVENIYEVGTGGATYGGLADLFYGKKK